MPSRFYWVPTHWDARGYFAPAAPADDPVLQKTGDVPFWMETQEILAQAKAGSFGRLERLVDIHQATVGSHLLPWVCAQILGDAGTPDCFKRMIRLLDDSVDPDMAGDFCHAFEAWGSLSSIPAIIQAYDRGYGADLMNSVPLVISTLLEPEWGPLSKSPKEDERIAYEDRVLEQYEALKQKFGTDQVALLHGERFSVVSVARRMLRGLTGGGFERSMRPFYRRRFEASTGIDCSSFYKDEKFQPLTAAAILEEFLESPESARYEEGVRYFFGHRIPE
jgi:hypothetical protein